MNLEYRIWKLATKKLAGEASEDELRELNELLEQNPDIYNTIKLVSEWWRTDTEQKDENNSHFLFKKVLARIKGNG
ncbi:MAG TPA: hypothetical protein VIM16_00520 [Mucilaginibacter sp.]|jgi:hypothetical protein